LNRCGDSSDKENQDPLCALIYQASENARHGFNSSGNGSTDGMLTETPVGASRNHMLPWSVRRMQVKRLLQDIYALI